MFQLPQSSLQVLHLNLLIGHLLLEVLRGLLAAEGTLNSGACQIVLFLRDSELGLACPLCRLLQVFLLLFFKKMLVGDCNRHLRFHLEKLILHIEDDLFDHLLGIFRLIDQVIDVGPD